MILDFYQHLPQYIDPIAFSIGSIPVRWYSLSYIAGFVVVYFFMRWIMENDTSKAAQIFNFQSASRQAISNKILNPKSKNNKKIQNTKYYIRNTILDFLLVAFFSALIGGRIGYVLLYDLSYFYQHPLSIVSVYKDGNLTGIYGMSYHGALVGVLAGGYMFARIKKIDFLRWADFVAPAAALGYFFGRVGNFLNGELYGRATTSPIGMYFSSDPNQLRHPSQLYEASLEGILLFVILWKMRKYKLPKGVLFAVYLVGYATARIFSEQFRQPDPQIGFIFGFLTLGQVLSLVMVAIGVGTFFIIKKNEAY